MPGIDHYAKANEMAAQMLQAQSGGSDGDTLTPEQQQAAIQQGEQQAAADLAAQGAESPAAPATEPTVPPDPAAPAAPAASAAPVAPAPDPNAAILAQLGFNDVGSMATKFKENAQALSAALTQLDQMAALEKALENEDDLDPKDPRYEIKKAMREEYGPLYENMKNDIRNRSVRDAWVKDAEGLADLGEIESEVNEYVMAHPELSMDKGGLKTAYHAVRSGKYRSPEKLLSDPEFQKQAAANPVISEAVIKAYLTKIAAAGESLPKSIDGSGGTPLTGKAAPVKNTNQAYEAAKKMLGM
jgi:hypothetical protein